jgi:hypothetical protein
MPNSSGPHSTLLGVRLQALKKNVRLPALMKRYTTKNTCPAKEEPQEGQLAKYPPGGGALQAILHRAQKEWVS